MLVFAGSSNKLLAKRIANKLKTRLGEMELSRFANDEARVWVKEKRVGPTAVLVQSLSQPTDQHLVEFCLIGDALRRKGVKEIIAVVPWMGYSKQDKVFRPGEPLSVKVVAKILQTVHIEKLITYDLHNLAILGFFDGRIENLSGRELFEEYFKNKVDEETTVVAPDEGAMKSAGKFADYLGVPVAFINKVRDLETGKVVIKGMSGQVRGKKVLIKDDMIATGSTLVETAKFLKQQGAKSIMVAATHHLYVNGAQTKLNQSPINQLIVTDTVEPKVKSKKLKIISVAQKIAEEIEA